MRRCWPVVALLVGLASQQAGAQAPPVPIATVRPLVDAWRQCALEKGRSFMRSGEPAETIAKVALYECRDQRQMVSEALYRANPAVPTSAIQGMEIDIRDYVVSIVVQAKSK